jgi:hypothetical protein
VPTEAAEPKTVAAKPISEAKVAEVQKPSTDEPSRPVAIPSTANATRFVTPDPTVAPAEHADLRLMPGGELVRLIVHAGGEGRRSLRAVELLAERDTSYYLFDELERLCRSGGTEQQLRGLQVIRNLRPPAEDSYRHRAHALLLQMVDPRNEPAVVKVALDTLAARGLPAEGSS